MKINNLNVNHLENPIGYDITHPVFSFQVAESTGKDLASARIRVYRDAGDTAPGPEIVYDSKMRTDISSLAFSPEAEFAAGQRYSWNVEAVADDGDRGISAMAWFEGGHPDRDWHPGWITSPYPQTVHPVFGRDVPLSKEHGKVTGGRLYVCGLGLYEAYLNGQKIGDEYLAPFCNDYRYWVQYQTYDVSKLLREEGNCLAVMLGNGWYKGRFGFGEEVRDIFGDEFKLAAELCLFYEDGFREQIRADESWWCVPAPVKESSIYDGEVYDARICHWDNVSQKETKPAVAARAPEGRLMQRLSLPVTIHERITSPVLIVTPKQELVLDFGQVVTGWVEFTCKVKTGQKVYLQYGEVLQEGNFYRDNLRTAKAEYTFIGNGQEARVRPHFTFYGFRYVKVEGLPLTGENLHQYQFTACALYSDLKTTGKITTANEKINRLIENTRWSQKDNFLDVPTDCPQRDERMGWTGDAQVFCQTASYHMDTAAFYRKYMQDLRLEQRQLNGSVPYVVPDFIAIVREKTGGEVPDWRKNEWAESGSCAWGDAACVIPWTLYEFYGDKQLLAEQYESMKGWTDFIIQVDEQYCGAARLWQIGFHFADWLALDNPDQESRFGRTDPYYVASVYYLYSACLTAKAARVLGKEQDAGYYERIAGEVRAAIQKEYITPAGRLAIDTQTAYVLAIYFDLVPAPFKARTVADFKQLLADNGMHLSTGFVGTAYLCRALTKAGLTREAYTLLLNEDCPSWLYEVNMGATTIWERWNSLLPDGRISDTGMNSLNHYAYGAVCEWLYADVCGISQQKDSTGFKKVLLAPHPDDRLEWVEGEYLSASGKYRIRWEYQKDGRVKADFFVPFGGEALFLVPAGMKAGEIEGLTERQNRDTMTFYAGAHSIMLHPEA